MVRVGSYWRRRGEGVLERRELDGEAIRGKKVEEDFFFFILKIVSMVHKSTSNLA
jgi:hypothetical protein